MTSAAAARKVPKGGHVIAATGPARLVSLDSGATDDPHAQFVVLNRAQRRAVAKQNRGK